MAQRDKVYMLVRDGQYIAAIIKGIANLNHYMSYVDKDLLTKLEIQPLRTDYPFEIIESKRSDGYRNFWILDTDYLKKNFEKSLEKMFPYDKLCSRYEVTHDFLGDPENPGRDYMGKMSHDHYEEDDGESDQADEA